MLADQSNKLRSTERGSQDSLSLLSVDMAAEGCTMERLVEEVVGRNVGLVSIVNTGLNAGVTRRETGWPQHGHIRHDSVCGGLVLHYHHTLRVQELQNLSSSQFPGVWVSVAGSPVLGETKERITVIGIFSCAEVTGLESHLSDCMDRVREKLGAEVEVVVGGNQSLEQTPTSPKSLESMVWMCPGPGQFLLHSPTLHLRPELVTDLGRGAVLGSLRPTGCSVCSVGFRSETELLEHRMTSEHKRKLILQLFQQQKPSLTKSPHSLGLEVSLVGEEAGVVQRVEGLVEVEAEPGQERQFQLQLRNVREAEEVGGSLLPGIVVQQVAVPRGGGVVRLSDEHGVTGQDTKIRIRYSKRYKINVTCSSQYVGQHKVSIVIIFYHDSFSEPMPTADNPDAKQVSMMVVDVAVKVQTTELVAMLPLEPYTPRPRTIEYWRARETVKGHIPPTVFTEESDFLVTRLPLGNYPLNELRSKLIGARFQGSADTVEEQKHLDKARKLLETELDAKNYSEKFQLLLHCEQWTEERDMRYFDMSGVEMKLERSTGLVVLCVPGLQEQRPSVLRGDKLYIRETDGGRLVEYEAFVHQVLYCAVLVCVCEVLCVLVCV